MSIAHKYKFFDMPTCPTSFKQWFSIPYEMSLGFI